MTKKIIYSLAIFFTILFAASSCKKGVDKKDDDDLAQSAQGTYEVYYVETTTGDLQLPREDLSIAISLNRTDKNTVSISSRTVTSGVSKDEPQGSAELKKENSTIAMYSGSEKIGSINNNEIEFHGDDTEGHPVIIKAKNRH